MQYSLLSRFQGGLLGSLLGETLARHALKSETTNVLDLKLSPWSEIGIELSDRLIESGYLSTSDWEQIYQRHQNCLGAKITPNSGEIALAVLPLLFFFHEDSGLLNEQLQPLCNIWQLPPELIEDICIIGYTIALALREQIDSKRVFAQILARYQGRKTLLIQQLEQFQTFLVQKTSLAEVIFEKTRQDSLKRAGIAMALYSFSYVPEDLQLSLMRATKMEKQTTTIAALTGAIAGAYNSWNGIPLSWRVAIQRHPIGRRQTRQSMKVFALWSGAYQSDPTDLLQSMAIASPLVIQPRLSLKIISQGEYSLTKSSHKVNSNVIKK